MVSHETMTYAVLLDMLRSWSWVAVLASSACHSDEWLALSQKSIHIPTEAILDGHFVQPYEGQPPPHMFRAGGRASMVRASFKLPVIVVETCGPECKMLPRASVDYTNKNRAGFVHVVHIFSINIQQASGIISTRGRDML